ncbi:DUF177 domain-containing protein [Thioalkalivibrio sp. ALJT]|uniref:YceD family protein n=1 Tax=Thioalkalivibrio sp. ALJT TaxID=1158146 RepID=UPI0003A9B53F|nr:YceD family protein [Thioalkalivibrio sp. ALJT]
MSRIPVSLDPWQPRARHLEFEGGLRPEDLPRLSADALPGHPLRVHAQFRLERGPLNEMRLSGTITGELWLTCQRCLQPMAWAFRLQPDAVLQSSEGMPAGVGEDDDRVELEADGLLRPAVWVEEEILLAWPLVPRHEDCEPAAGPEFEAGERGDNPFAVLEQLKKSGPGGDSS